MAVKRTEIHAHTRFSNLRLLDAINDPEALIDRAIELGLDGIAITEHESLSSHIIVNKYAQKIAEKHPDFKCILGNEIYLCDAAEPGVRNYHFILLAKNALGHKALRELSSMAWLGSFHDRGLERVITTKESLANILQKYPNSLIGTSACLGGELSTCVREMKDAEAIGDMRTRTEKYNQVIAFIEYCQATFGDDFYIECAPSRSEDQLKVNDTLKLIADIFNIKMVIGTDAHYLTKEDRYTHKAYLNSKGGEREVDMFYEYAYLQTEEEIKAHLQGTILDYDQMVINSREIYEKIENYSLLHKSTIPMVQVKDYKKQQPAWAEAEFPTLFNLFNSDNDQERYWVNECVYALNPLFDDLCKEYFTYLERLEAEADVIKHISNELEDNLFAYFNTMKHYIDMFWEEGSIVGPGRGSATGFLSNYLLGITQLDPIVWNLPYWRFLNKDRAELPDIDIDLAPSKRPQILQRIKNERGGEFACTLIATFGTEQTKSTVLTACRGYRSEEFPDGIEVDIAQYMSSLIPSERGFLWPLTDVINGNKDKGRKPVHSFIAEVNKYSGLLDIMFGIEGMVNKRSSHASGVILFGDDPFELGCFMKTPGGDIITQWDLHMCEDAGMTKYDYLVTEISDKIIQTFELLEEDGIIEPRPLREQYDIYLHPSSIDINDQRIWDALGEGSVLDCFQFSTDVGLMAAKKLKPQTPLEMTDANALMRLMSERGQESPIDKHARFKANIQLWYNEMKSYGLTQEQVALLEPYYKKSYGTPPLQEDLMLILLDKDIAGFTLAEVNDARKIVAKKQMSRIPELKKKMFEAMPSEAFANYVWDTAIAPQLGYAFSLNHSLAYSFVGIQSLILATSFNPIYWNTACLRVNSGALDIENEKATDYGKIAKAIGDIISKGIKVSLVDINKSGYSFTPDTENNEILFGMKGLRNVGAAVVQEINESRPYTSLDDFLSRVNVNRTAIISLIKAGAFDRIENKARTLILAEYLWTVCDKKKRITLQNFNGLMQYNLIPEELDFQKRVFVFNKHLKSYCKFNNYYLLMNNHMEFYENFFDMSKIEVDNDQHMILQAAWDKIYKSQMEAARNYFQIHQTELLKAYNKALFKECWEKYAAGTVSAWEMQSLGFYHSEHELAHVKLEDYDLVDFAELPEKPLVDYFFKRNGIEIPIYKTFKIIGTVIAKNDTKSIVTILTTSGVVNVKFSKDYYARFKRQLSEEQEDGTKKVVEKGWFGSGTKILVTGFRRGDQFQAKSYKKTTTHQLYKITDVTPDGQIELMHFRYGEENED